MSISFQGFNGIGLKFGVRKGMVLINASLVCLKSLPNFHDENLVAFCLIFHGRNPWVRHSTQNTILTKLL